MRLVILPVAAFALTGATDAEDRAKHIPDTAEVIVLPLDNPSYLRTPTQVRLIQRAQNEAVPSDEECRDRITQAREAAGKPPLLDREPASPEKPYHIYAVDRRQDGCAVMVMKGDPADIRPLPSAPDGPIVVTPAGSER
ncbi:hypothetical protein [Porphyrobacter sp. AAP60]|uniref:hypothetical protein n=1 Tax=Porphyrobacter sp. AAP60 TaxID=1523423 RepID=UPI0006B8D544|nr:hypothetical protein [Porphyrobacter sp. AAP60]